MTTSTLTPEQREEMEKQFPDSTEDLPMAKQSRWANRITFGLVLTAIALWTVRRVLTGQSALAGEDLPFFWYFCGTFALLAFQLVLAFLEKTKYPNHNDNFVVAVIIPLYNEDPALAWRAIKSILFQRRRPDYLVVVNDGSHQQFNHAYWLMHWAAYFVAKTNRVELLWKDTPNQGKRHAQITALGMLPASVTHITTVDSDSALDHMAIQNTMAAFFDPKIQAVAGVVLSMNTTANPLTCVMDLIFGIQQLTDRSAMSRVGSVMVCSGAMTTYDADVLRDNKEAYLNENFMGKPVEFSDDSLLTLFALKRGKVIQHPGVFSFSMMPERFNHHAKQQLRWMRGSFIRSIWRLRYLSIASWGFWRQLIGWAQGLATLIVSATLLVFYPIFEHKIVWEYALVPFIVGYILALRYYGIRRSDMTFWQQTGIFLLGPIAWVYQASVLRFFRFYGALTCRKTGWATRQNGAEVTLNKQQQAA